MTIASINSLKIIIRAKVIMVKVISVLRLVIKLVYQNKLNLLGYIFGNAIFNGKIVRVGYISNYASAHANFLRNEPIFISQVVASGSNKDGDNPADLEAIRDGWQAYWQSPNEG